MNSEPTILTASEDANCACNVAPEASTQGREAKPQASRIAVESLKRIVSFPTMLGVFLIGWTFSATRIFHVDPDVWWHIKVGQDILRTHHWPTSDSYSFTVSGA